MTTFEKVINEFNDEPFIFIKTIELLEELYFHINEYYKLLQDYNNDIDILPPNNESISNETINLEELNACIIRITNDIINLGKVLKSEYIYTDTEIANSNEKLVRLSGRYYAANGEYHSINTSTLLDKIHADFLNQIEILNNLIIEYNTDKENKLFTLKKALTVWQDKNIELS
jgi:hypothetical protein